MKKHFPKDKYNNVPGVCSVAALSEIETQGWSLNPGRYVGVADISPDDFEFIERLEELYEELEALNTKAREMEEQIAENIQILLEAKDI